MRTLFVPVNVRSLHLVLRQLKRQCQWVAEGRDDKLRYSVKKRGRMAVEGMGEFKRTNLPMNKKTPPEKMNCAQKLDACVGYDEDVQPTSFWARLRFRLPEQNKDDGSDESTPEWDCTDWRFYYTQQKYEPAVRANQFALARCLFGPVLLWPVAGS